MEELMQTAVNALAEAVLPQHRQEFSLFKESLEANCKTLNRQPGPLQISKAWLRWKRERGLSLDKEDEVDLSTLYKPKARG